MSGRACPVNVFRGGATWQVPKSEAKMRLIRDALDSHFMLLTISDVGRGIRIMTEWNCLPCVGNVP